MKGKFQQLACEERGPGARGGDVTRNGLDWTGGWKSAASFLHFGEITAGQLSIGCWFVLMYFNVQFWPSKRQNVCVMMRISDMQGCGHIR